MLIAPLYCASVERHRTFSFLFNFDATNIIDLSSITANRVDLLRRSMIRSGAEKTLQSNPRLYSFDLDENQFTASDWNSRSILLPHFSALECSPNIPASSILPHPSCRHNSPARQEKIVLVSSSSECRSSIGNCHSIVFEAEYHGLSTIQLSLGRFISIFLLGTSISLFCIL